MTMLEYIEGNDGSQTFTGPATGTRYIFGGTRLVGLVDSRDAPGLLAIRIHKQLIFKQLTNPQPLQVPEPAQREANPVVSPVVSKDNPLDPTTLTVREIKALDLTQVQAGQMLMQEIAGKNRKGVTDYLEGLLVK